jgi:enoyl-CoA hydratase
VPAGSLEHLGIFTEVLDDDAVADRAEWYAQKVARMPADGLVIAKEAFRLVEQLQRAFELRDLHFEVPES